MDSICFSLHVHFDALFKFYCVFFFFFSKFTSLDEPLIEARVGSNYAEWGGQVYKIKNNIRHPSFDKDTADYDFSLLELDEPIKWSSNVKPIRMVFAGEVIADNVVGRVTGWGRTTVKVRT